jgi:pyrroloquinoline quinone biosynthesis protein B
MKVVVLGSAAGRGVPQWSCECPSCQAVRRPVENISASAPSGSRLSSRTQQRSPDSLAVSADGQRWFLLNVSPDITRQLEKAPALRPAAGDASEGCASPIIGAVLTNGDLDHSMGLLSLTTRAPLCLYATRETYAGLVVQNAVFRMLHRQRPQLSYRPLELDVFIPLLDPAGVSSGLSLCAFSVAGKVPLQVEWFIEPSDETNVGLIVRDDETGARIVYVPGAASAEGIAQRAREACCLFFDGTFWSDAELSVTGRAPSTARAMAHVPVSGPGGSLQLLGGLPIPRRYYTHVDQTNPMLREGSAERRAVEARGWSVAEDGLELAV